MPDVTHYDVLGIARTATAREVHRAYLDVKGSEPPNSQQLARAHAAWTTLTSPAARAKDHRLLPPAALPGGHTTSRWNGLKLAARWAIGMRLVHG